MLSHGASSDSWCEPSLIGAIWSIEALEHDFEHLSSLLKPNAGSQCFPQRFPQEGSRCLNLYMPIPQPRQNHNPPPYPLRTCTEHYNLECTTLP